MYEQDSAFGKVRFGYTPTQPELAHVVDQVTGSAWYRCNDLYRAPCLSLNDNEFVLMLTLDGMGELVMSNNRCLLLPRSVTIVPLAEKHIYRTRPGCKWEFYWMSVRGLHCSRILQHVCQHSGCTFQAADYREISRAFSDIINSPNRGKAYEIQAAYDMQKLLFSLMQPHVLRQNKADTIQTFAEKVMQRIENESFQEVSIKRIAESMYVSKEHLIRMFKRETGKTPHQYIIERRIAYSCKLLSDTRMQIKQIAHGVGYKTTSSFSSQFRKSIGMSPMEYRVTCCKTDTILP